MHIDLAEPRRFLCLCQIPSRLGIRALSTTISQSPGTRSGIPRSAGVSQYARRKHTCNPFEPFELLPIILDGRTRAPRLRLRRRRLSQL